MLASPSSTMLVLGIDTASPAPSLALVDASGTGPERVLGRSAAEGLPAEVAELLSSAGRTLAEVEAVAVVSGPGSFTGLRAGLAFSRGLARARGLPLVLVPTFAAAMEDEPAPPDADFVLDAGRGEVHLARRRGAVPDGEPVRLPRASLAPDGPLVDLDARGRTLARAAAALAARGAASGGGGPLYGRVSAAEERFGR